MAMKLAVAGKGGVGKTSLTAWLGDYLARLGREVWLVDADTAYSLGPALGLSKELTPAPLCELSDLILERTSYGVINLNPQVGDLPERLSVPVRDMRLLVMGTVVGAGAGCGCAANALLKALLAHLFLENYQWVLVDLEAGVEHLGRGTAASADGLVVVSDLSLRGLRTAASIASLAKELGLVRQALVLNRAYGEFELPEVEGLPPLAGVLPELESLRRRQLRDTSVLDLPQQPEIDRVCAGIIQFLAGAGQTSA